MVNSFTLSPEEDITNAEEGDLKSAVLFDCLTVTVHENENGDFWPRSWILDYGKENCECDNKVTVTTNGVSETIEL